MGDATHGGRGLDERMLLVAAGLADLAVSAAGSAVGTLRGLLSRADGADLAQDAERDLRARGRLALDRWASVPPAHLEVLARHVVQRGGDGDADGGVHGGGSGNGSGDESGSGSGDDV